MYISNSNLQKILRTVVENDDFLEKLYSEDLKFVLSKDERSLMAKAKTFFECPDRLTLRYKPIETTDRYQYIFEGNTPAYHANAACKRLHSNYINYYLPSDVRAKGTDEINKFRRYISNARKAGEQLDSDAFILSVRAQFQISDLNFGKVERSNTGAASFSKELENRDLAYINLSLQKIYKELAAFKDISTLHKKIYQMRYFDANKIKRMAKLSSDEEKGVAEEFAELKAKLIIALTELYKKESGFKQEELEEKILTNLGFHRCSECCGNGSGSPL